MFDLSDLSKSLRTEAAAYGMVPPETFGKPPAATERGQLTRRRRRGEFGAGEDCGLMELRRDADGVLRWSDGFAGPSVASAGGKRRGLRRESRATGEFVDQLQFERLKPNQIGDWLTTLDEKLTPMKRGLLQLTKDASAWVEPALPLPQTGRVLLLVHGTFSSSGNFLQELRATPEGQDFLAAALKNYAAVYAFEHSTLSVSPWLNALDLSRALEGLKADVDIIAHSRGGLVARWWADCLDHAPRTRRCVFVGSPLAGTSLAAPGAIRQTMDMFTNIAEVTGKAADMASSMVPLLSVVSGMMRLVGSLTGAIARLPIADALIAAIPGLHGQSATSNNYELQRLRSRPAPAGTEHLAVRSDFQPQSEGWKFWRYFTKAHAANAAADHFIFRQANDLVVDYAHMTSLADSQDPGSTLSAAAVLDLGTNEKVWHCNYFRQPAVLTWLRSKLAF